MPCDPHASARTRRPHDIDHLLPLLRGPVLKPRCPSELSRVDRSQSGRPDWSAAPYPTHWDADSVRTRLGFFSRWSYRSSPVDFGPPPSGRLERRRLLNLLRCHEAVQRSDLPTCFELADISANPWKHVNVVLSVSHV